MAAIEAFALLVRATATGLPYTAAPRNHPVLATGHPGITERGVRSVLVATGGPNISAGAGRDRVEGSGPQAAVPAAGPNGGSSVSGEDVVAATGGTGRSVAS